MRRLIGASGVALAILLLGAGRLSAQTSEPPANQNPTTAEQGRIDELERRIRELEARIRELEASAPKPHAPIVTPIPPDPPPPMPPPPQPAIPSLGPPAVSDEASMTSRTGPISGYMDFHLNNPEHEDPILDFHRFVLLFNHSFTDRIRFVGELELEHAFVSGLEASGELELEQAYLDFRATPALNFRAGMLLAPVGIINERHEPPSFFGVERPFVDTFIIPTTWFDAGAGVHGAVGAGWQYRAYLMAPLDATQITAEEGLRETPQKGFESNVRHVAGTGRLEYVGYPGLTLGASFWRGGTSFNFPRGDSHVGLIEFDGRFHRGPLGARAEFAQVFVDGAAELNDFLQRATGVNPNIPREMRGFYIEPSLRPLPWIRHDFGAFFRYENFDTQFKMPDGILPLKQFDRTAWVIGGSYYPDPDVVLKIDYSIVRNRSSLFRSVDALNVGLGWWF